MEEDLNMKRVTAWPIGFLHHFLESVCRPTPFVYTVLMSMVYNSLKKGTWRTDEVLLCKDCTDWALQVNPSILFFYSMDKPRDFLHGLTYMLL